MKKNNTPPILGLGNDIIEIERIKDSLSVHHEHFLQKLFTPAEQLYFANFKDPIAHIAGRFAAKEAVAKAMGTGFGKELSWLDIEICNNDLGRPFLSPSCNLIKTLAQGSILISISHCKSYASAVAIWMDH